MPRRKRLPNGELEHQILEILWTEARPMNPGDVHAIVSQSHDIAYTTAMTVLTRLYEKGSLTRHKTGRSYSYEPVLGREALAAQRMQEVLDASGDHTVALSRFVDALESDQRTALRSILRRRKSTP